MKTSISLLAASLLASVVACGDDGGNAGDAAVVSTFPAEGFVGRTTSVIIVGEDTAFSDASTVDFGEGVTVDSVMAVGSTGLMVQITAALDAPTGPRAVTVDGLSLADGFNLAQPIEVTVVGTPAQGSISLVQVTNLDLLNPFDLTTDETGAFINLAVSVEGGSVLFADRSENALAFELDLDVNAAAGPTAIDIISGPEATVSRHVVDVQARDPIALSPGTISETLANGLDSALYSFTADGLTELVLQPPITELGGGFLVILGSSGSFDDEIGFAGPTFFGPQPFSGHIPEGETVYAVFWEGAAAGALDYSFDVGVLAAAAGATIDEVEPNDAQDAAQAVTLPGGVFNASFEGELDEDWFSVIVEADDVGKVLTVSSAGRSEADTVLTIVDTDGATPLAGPEDVLFFDRLSSAPIAAEGTYFVRITSSPEAGETDPTISAYSLVIALKDAPPPPPE